MVFVPTDIRHGNNRPLAHYCGGKQDQGKSHDRPGLSQITPPPFWINSRATWRTAPVVYPESPPPAKSVPDTVTQIGKYNEIIVVHPTARTWELHNHKTAGILRQVPRPVMSMSVRLSARSKGLSAVPVRVPAEKGLERPKAPARPSGVYA